MTPWQLNTAFDAYVRAKEEKHDHDAWMMWHNAMLTRVKKFPELKGFLAGASKKPVKRIDQHAIMARLKAYQRKKVEDGHSSQT